MATALGPVIGPVKTPAPTVAAAPPPTAGPTEKPAAAQSETARPVEASTRSNAVGPARAAFATEIQSMLDASSSGVETGPTQSTRLIGELLDALRAYDRTLKG